MDKSLQSLVLTVLTVAAALGWQPATAEEPVSPSERRTPPQARPASPAQADAARPLPRTDRIQVPGTLCKDCPDLAPGSCVVECTIGPTTNAEICASDGYKSSFGFRVTLQPGVRNGGTAAATIPAGKRLFAVSGPSSGGGIAPSTGLYIAAGAAAPQPVQVRLTGLSAGVHVVRFEVDPDQAVTESNETNNAVDCPLTVIDAAAAPKQPDLTLDPIQVTPTTGNHQTQFLVAATVRNRGSGYSSPLVVSCTPGVVNRMHTLPPGGEFRAGGYVQNVASLPPGTHTVTCVLKTDLPEASEVNHTRTATLTIE